MIRLDENETISLASSIRFRFDTALMTNVDNTLSCEIGKMSYQDVQYFYPSDNIPLQIRSENEPTVTFHADYDKMTPAIIPNLSYVFGDTKIWEYLLSFSSSGYLTISLNGTNNYKATSERIEIVEEKPIKIEWFGFGTNFNFDYDSGIINFNRFDGVINWDGVKSKSKVYDNQSEEVKLKETLFRKVKLSLAVVSSGIAEKLSIAAAHDVFLVNDVEYILDAPPSIKELGFANLYELTLKMTEKFALGQNSYDTGGGTSGGSSGGGTIPTLPYSIFTDTDPATVPVPASGKVYFGSFNGRLWKKLPSGAITYMQKEVTLNDSYTASGSEANVTLSYLIGAVGIQIVKETQPLKDSEFTFDSLTGTITFVNVNLEQYETIFITYQKNIDL